MNRKIGTAVMIVKEENGIEKFLLGLRTGSHAANLWALPGGSEDPEDESITKAAIREVKEETGLEVIDIKEYPLWFEDNFVEDNKYYVCLFFIATVEDKEPEIIEAHKCLEWKYFSFTELPDNLMPGTKRALEDYVINKALINNMNKNCNI